MQSSDKRVCNKCSCLVLFNEIDSGYGGPWRWISKSTGSWVAEITQCPNCRAELSNASTTAVKSWTEQRVCSSCGQEVRARIEKALDFFSCVFTPADVGWGKIERCPNCGELLILDETALPKE